MACLPSPNHGLIKPAFLQATKNGFFLGDPAQPHHAVVLTTALDPVALFDDENVLS
jgi:hypothetical protein